jgi:two-component system response regulator HydG
MKMHAHLPADSTEPVSARHPSHVRAVEAPELVSPFSIPRVAESRLLVIDGEGGAGDFIEQTLRDEGAEPFVCASVRDALDLVPEVRFDVVLVIGDPDMAGDRISELWPDATVVHVKGPRSDASPGSSVHEEAAPAIAARAVERALTHRRLGPRLRSLARELEHGQWPSGLVGRSPAMNHLFELLERVGDSEATVLVTGERGTGKELIARAIHEHSARRDGPFVTVDCGSTGASVLEEELFGTRPDRAGALQRASGGTLVLVEIGGVPPELQLRLLRALEERRIRTPGGGTDQPFDARVIATTHRDLDIEVEAGKFREDLYYRIRIVEVESPPLRARGEDVLLLAQHFVSMSALRTGGRVTGVGPDAADKLLRYDWPGNVGELQCCIEHAISLARKDELGLQDLPDGIRYHQPEEGFWGTCDTERLPTLDELLRRYMRRALTMVSGNKSKAARILGVKRRTLRRMLDRFP